jgi:hypothetical protein
MNQLIDNRGGLFRTIRIQVDPVSADEGFACNCQERCPVPDAGINGGARRSWIPQAGLDSTRFGKWQREVSEPKLSLIPHGCSFPVFTLT